MFVFTALVHTLVRMSSTARLITLSAAVLGFLGVLLGALGAHALKPTLEASGRMAAWETAVLYHLIHAVALLALARIGGRSEGRIATCWVAGVVLFSGSIYWLALGGPRLLGPVTPLGGVAFLIGWGWLAVTAWRQPAN